MNKNDCEFQQKSTTSTDRVKQPFYSQSVGLKSCNVQCNDSNDTSLPVISHGTICFSGIYKMKMFLVFVPFLW